MNKELSLICIVILQYKVHYTLEQRFNLVGRGKVFLLSLCFKTRLSLRISVFTGELGGVPVFCSLQLTRGKASKVKRLREPKLTLHCYVGVTRELFEDEQLLVEKTEWKR